MTDRRFGIEEESMLVDPATLRPMNVAAKVLEELPDDAGYVAEFLAPQIEYVSPIFTSAEDALPQLHEAHAALRNAAEHQDALVWRGATPYDTIMAQPDLTDDGRYKEIGDKIGRIRHGHQIDSTHVHVEVESLDEAVHVMNVVRPWMGVLVALGANSPYWFANDTDFASWRCIQQFRWSTTVCPPEFVDGEDYLRRCKNLEGIASIRDAGTVAWFMRPSQNHPTLEFRIYDSQLEPEDALTMALVSRGLVAAAAENDASEVAMPFDPELLNASVWHGARHGLEADLVHPFTGKLAPAREVIDKLSEVSGVDLSEFFDKGTGAARQRAAFAENGLVGLASLS